MNKTFSQNYDDIINTSWPPASRKENCMSLENRAKIFLPFAALKGFEAEVDSRLRNAILKTEEKKSSNPTLLQPELL